jgi:hypothetical protein
MTLLTNKIFCFTKYNYKTKKLQRISIYGRSLFVNMSQKVVNAKLHAHTIYQIEVIYRHSPIYAVVTLPKVRHKSNFAQVGIEYTYGQLYMYIKGSPI